MNPGFLVMVLAAASMGGAFAAEPGAESVPVVGVGPILDNGGFNVAPMVISKLQRLEGLGDRVRFVPADSPVGYSAFISGELRTEISYDYDVGKEGERTKGLGGLFILGFGIATTGGFVNLLDATLTGGEMCDDDPILSAFCHEITYGALGAAAIGALSMTITHAMDLERIPNIPANKYQWRTGAFFNVTRVDGSSEDRSFDFSDKRASSTPLEPYGIAIDAPVRELGLWISGSF